jgi:Holliday junction resolvase-like predicted endonuclease
MRTARRFLSERHVKECPIRFDVVAIEEVPANRRSFCYIKRRFIHRCKRRSPKGIRIRQNLLK